MAAGKARRPRAVLVNLLTGDLYEYPRKVRGQYVAKLIPPLRNTGGAQRKGK